MRGLWRKLLQYPQTDRNKRPVSTAPSPTSQADRVYQEKPDTSIDFALGTTNHKLLPLLNVEQVLAGSEGDEHGWRYEYFDNPNLAGDVVSTERNTSSEQMWFSAPANAGFDLQNFSARRATTSIVRTGY